MTEVAEKWLRRIALVLLSVFVMFMMTLTTLDVVGRYVFGSPLPGTQEMTELLLAVLVFGAAPLVALDRVHITTDLMESAIRGRTRRVRDVSVGVLSCLACGVLAWRIAEQAGSMSAMGGRTPLVGVPIGPVLYFCAAMCALSALLVVVQTAVALRPR
jgi:TRAP-type C4-dicarboxylate transport system permease small subunit